MVGTTARLIDLRRRIECFRFVFPMQADRTIELRFRLKDSQAKPLKDLAFPPLERARQIDKMLNGRSLVAALLVHQIDGMEVVRNIGNRNSRQVIEQETTERIEAQTYSVLVHIDHRSERNLVVASFARRKPLGIEQVLHLIANGRTGAIRYQVTVAYVGKTNARLCGERAFAMHEHDKLLVQNGNEGQMLLALHTRRKNNIVAIALKPLYQSGSKPLVYVEARIGAIAVTISPYKIGKIMRNGHTN